MFNPLAPLNEAALDGLVKAGHRFFVRQTFNRAKDHFDEGIKGYFLFCHYEDYFRAKEHFDVLLHDPYRRIYDWETNADRDRLLVAAQQPPGFRVFTNTFLPDWERHLTNRLHAKIWRYVQQLGWKPKSGEAVQPQFYPHFGEVYVSLKLGSREVRVNFEEIEKLI